MKVNRASLLKRAEKQLIFPFIVVNDKKITVHILFIQQWKKIYDAYIFPSSITDRKLRDGIVQRYISNWV